ncbi:MAG: hypothetical protein JO222_03185 [Frankiales bacterium]|nr:hypothetical protein [Frankiales bacterium]
MTHAAENPAVGDRRPLELPARRQVWVWGWSLVRPYLGWVLALLGGLALFLGWYGVSGEALTAKQIPYLVSGGLTGIGLVILASVFLATEDVRRQLARVAELERKVDDLYGLFVQELGAAPATTGESTDTAVVALPAGSSYHRPGCSLVAGKSDAAAVTARDVKRRSLRPCRVCEPPTV